MTTTWSTNTKKNETEFINYLFHMVASFIEENEYYSLSDQNRW